MIPAIGIIHGALYTDNVTVPNQEERVRRRRRGQLRRPRRVERRRGRLLEDCATGIFMTERHMLVLLGIWQWNHDASMAFGRKATTTVDGLYQACCNIIEYKIGRHILR